MEDENGSLSNSNKKRHQYQSTGGIDLEVIDSFALQNAIAHDGEASVGSVIGSAIQYFKKENENVNPKVIVNYAGKKVNEINSMTISEQNNKLNDIGLIELEKRERKTGLPDLEGAGEGNVVMRFAPGPSGPLHLGHTRAAVLNDEFCRRYDGEFILRMEDTNPEKIDPQAYDMIPEDLEWLGIKVDKTYIQSDRFEQYYKVARELIEKGAAYVCTIDIEVWRELKFAGKPCGERDLDVEAQLDKWDKMLDGTLAEGEASLVIKTDLSHKNPAVRDFVGMRIREAAHPRTGKDYRVYPLYNLSVAIDDHLMGCTHILRGKDHLNNTLRQEYVYRYLNWKEPVFIHYGLVSIPDTILKTSLIKEDISTGKYSGWGDVRLGTIRALAARGFDPRALREYWIDVGLKSADIQFSWENFYSMNRSLIDGDTKRLFFVPSPAEIHFDHNRELQARIPVHPEHPEMGERKHLIEPEDGIIHLFVPSEDVQEVESGAVMRLKDLCNIKILNTGSGRVEYAGQDIPVARKNRSRIVQWVKRDGVEMTLIMPDGTHIDGVAEKDVLDAARNGENIQFERVGYFRTYYENGVKANFMHP